LNAAVGERLLCELAIRLVEQGLSLTEIVDQLNTMKHKINLIAIVDTLEYLKKGGRISKTVAFAGELLAIKPVISVVDGEVKVIGKARGSKNAKNLLNQTIMEKGGINFELPCGAVYSGLSSAMLEKYIEDHRFVWESHMDKVPMYIVGSTIGTHVGPGAFGIAYFEK
jgi:DegV family protein with EDD domain